MAQLFLPRGGGGSDHPGVAAPLSLGVPALHGAAPSAAPAASVFGAPAGLPVFGGFGGAAAHTGGMFGGAGAPVAASASLFGAAPAAAPTASVFGAPAPAAGGGLFGGLGGIGGGGAIATAPAAGVFGSIATPAAASASLFGAAPAAAPTASVFGVASAAAAAGGIGGGLLSAAGTATSSAIAPLFGAVVATATSNPFVNLGGIGGSAPALAGVTVPSSTAVAVATGGSFAGFSASSSNVFSNQNSGGPNVFNSGATGAFPVVPPVATDCLPLLSPRPPTQIDFLHEFLHGIDHKPSVKDPNGRKKQVKLMSEAVHLHREHVKQCKAVLKFCGSKVQNMKEDQNMKAKLDKDFAKYSRQSAGYHSPAMTCLQVSSGIGRWRKNHPGRWAPIARHAQRHRFNIRSQFQSTRNS